MATLGEELREAREKLGLTLEQIAETTRISHTFLKALEEDNYTVIPGEIFVTGFLKTYAKELGLDEKHVVARYRELHRPAQEEAEPVAAPQPVKARVQHFPKPSLLRIRRGYATKKKVPLYLIILGGLLVGALLTGITVLLTPKEKQVEIPAAPAKQVEAPKPAPSQPFKPASSAFRPATTVGKVQPPPVQTPPPAQTPEPSALSLKLTASGNCWYFYRSDNGERMRGTMRKGDVLNVTAKDRIVLTLGNAGVVAAEYNGKALPPFGKPGMPAKNLLFTKDVAGVPTPPNAVPGKGAMPLRTSHKRR